MTLIALALLQTSAVGAISPPQVTYTGHHEFTISFETSGSYASYEVELFDSTFVDWTDWNAPPGRTLTKTGITASPVVVNPSNFGDFAADKQGDPAPTSAATYTVKVVGIAPNGDRTKSGDGLNPSGGTLIEAMAEATAPTQVGICGMYEYEDSGNAGCAVVRGRQEPLSLRVYFQGSSAWGGSTGSPIELGYYYILELSVSPDFSTGAVATESVASAATTPDGDAGVRYDATQVVGLGKGEVYYARVTAFSLFRGGSSDITDGEAVIGAPDPPTISTATGVFGGPYIELQITRPGDTGFAGSKQAPMTDYMIQISAVATFDSPSTLTVAWTAPEGESLPETDTRLYASDSIAFLAINHRYYVRANASNAIARSGFSSIVDTGLIELRFNCEADAFLWGMTKGSEKCYACPSYSASPALSEGNSSCKCNVGYSGNDGAACSACNSTSFKTVSGSSPCQKCPSNSLTTLAATGLEDCKCSKGYSGITSLLGCLLPACACLLPY